MAAEVSLQILIVSENYFPQSKRDKEVHTEMPAIQLIAVQDLHLFLFSDVYASKCSGKHH